MLEMLVNLIKQNFGTKVISVIIAMVLWFIILLASRNDEVTKRVPLEVITPPELVVANEVPESISFRLSGPKAFLRTILDRRDDPIQVKLSGAKPMLMTYRFFSGNISLPIGVKVISVTPSEIAMKLEYVKRRDVPVRVELRGLPPEGYRVVRTEVKPEVVRIKGAESKVDSVTEISTLPIDISDQKQSLDREVALDLNRYGVRLEGALPRVLVEIEPASANFRIKNVDIRVLSPYKATVAEGNVTVLVRAAPDELKALDRSKLYGVIDLRGKPKGKYKESVKVVLPGNVKLVKVIPDRVNITLE